MKLKFNVPKDERVKFDSYSVYLGHHNVKYRGVKAIRAPFDFLLYQMIFHEVKPDLIIEIGSHTGGGAYYLADLMELEGKGMVHGIDIEDKMPEVVHKHPRIKLFLDGYDNYDLKNAEGYERILVIDDASHHYEHVMDTLEKFSPLVAKESYFIVEDGIVDELNLSKQYNGGPCRAIREWLPHHPEFIVDRKWCDFFGKNATFNVNGFLKKIK